MRAVVCAYSEVGHECLAELVALGVDLPLVVTHRDAPGEKRWFRSVADLATRSGLEVVTPRDVNAPEVRERIEALRPEFLFSFYFRHMLRKEVLAIPTRGALNLHGSLLPHYRGRAPVNWVLVHGERETGVTLHYMDEKPDHGDIVARRAVPIDRDDTALSLTGKLAAAGREVLREVVPLLDAGTAPRIPQDHSQSSYFGGRRPEDGEIDWRQPAEQIRNLVRAVTDPWPGAYSRLRGRPLMVWWCETGTQPLEGGEGEIRVDAAGVPWVTTGEGSLHLSRVGREGEAPLDGAQWVLAESIRSGERFEASSRGTR